MTSLFKQIKDTITPRGEGYTPPKQRKLRVGESILNYGFADNDYVQLEYKAFKHLIDNQGGEARVVYKEDRTYKMISLVLGLIIALALFSGYQELFRNASVFIAFGILLATMILAIVRQTAEKPQQVEEKTQEKPEPQMTAKDRHKYLTATAMLRQIGR